VRSEKVTSPIAKSKINKQLSIRILTMDIETITVDNIQIPYLLSWYDGNTPKSYFISSSEAVPGNKDNSMEIILKKVMSDICINQYKNYHIYLHNFANFDSYFLVKHLVKIGICKTIIKDGKFISLKFSMNGITVNFKDSYLLLPSSLRNLSKSFNVDTQKSIFPYLLSDINYVGSVPEYKYFTNLSIADYNSYCLLFTNKIWNFKDESRKYCEIDCISLYQNLTKFSVLIYNKFQVNITRYPTLPSLSFSIWRTHYLNTSIPSLDEKEANKVR
jgi:DNA polymerase elongation subunit (family B)